MGSAAVVAAPVLVALALAGGSVHRASGRLLAAEPGAWRVLDWGRTAARAATGGGPWPELHPAVSPAAGLLSAALQLPLAGARPAPQLVEIGVFAASLLLLGLLAGSVRRALVRDASARGAGTGSAAVALVVAVGAPASALAGPTGLLAALAVSLVLGPTDRGFRPLGGLLAGLCGLPGLLLGPWLLLGRDRAPLDRLAGALALVPAGTWAGLLLGAGWPLEALGARLAPLWLVPWALLLVGLPLLRALPTSPAGPAGAAGPRWVLALPLLGLSLAAQGLAVDTRPTWLGEAQLSRLAAEHALPGGVAVRPGAMASWRADRTLVDLSCDADAARARACLEAEPRLLAGPDGEGVRSLLLLRDPEDPPLGELLGLSAVAVRRWSDGQQRLDLFAVRREDVKELSDRADAYEVRRPARLRADHPSEDRVGWVPEPTDACIGAAPLVLELVGPQLVSSTGEVMGGRLWGRGTDVVLPGPWQAGRYELELALSVTAFDGEGARLSLVRDTLVEAGWTVPEGAGRTERLGFELADPWAGPLSLRYDNDASDDRRDRNVQLGLVRVRRTGALAPAERAAWLRAETAGASVLLVSVDTLRADHLGAYGYHRPTSPVIDALAAGGSRFTQAVAASHWTAPSHASLLTGLHPVQHGVRDFPAPERLGAEVRTLAERLSEAGYATAGFAAGLYVGEGIGLADGFETWHESVQPAEVRMGQARDWLRTHAASAPAGEAPEPFLLFVHTYQVHDPYDPPPPYDRWFQADPTAPIPAHLTAPLSETALQGWRPDAAELDALVSLYDGEIRYTDAALGGLLDTLLELGLDERTLVVLTSDHGEEFFDHGWVGHGRLYRELVKVPLVLAHPAMPGLVEEAVHQPTGHVDVLPTILDLLGLELPRDLPGRSALPAMVGDCDESARAWSTSVMNRNRGLSRWDRATHYIDDDGRQHLFAHPEDPTEARDLAGETPEERDGLARDAEAWWQTLDLQAPTEPVARTDEEIEQLRLLGYVD